MPIAAETFRPQHFEIQKTRPFVPQVPEETDKQVPDSFLMPGKEKEKLPGSVVDRYIKYFDRNWRQENLPQDWFTLRSLKGKHVGFSMRSQMELLQNPQDQEEVASWTQKTKQDLLGFKLEYLSDHIVYPCKYEKSATDPTRLENALYGNADMVETVTKDERNGSVVRGLQEMKGFFLSDQTEDGAVAIMNSPRGDSGLRTDDGKAIRYPDSYFFIMQKQGDTVMNYTLKTDFSISECREALFRLTGKRLSPTAPLEEYVETIAKIQPRDGVTPHVEDIVMTLESIRPEYAFKMEGKKEKTMWSEVYADVAQGEKLYEFNTKTQEIIEEFEAYCLEGNHTKEELQKAIATTILRMSKYFFTEEQPKAKQSGTMQPQEWVDMKRVSTFGSALNEAAERPGCAGGGSNTSSWVKSMVTRAGSSSIEDEYGSLDFECPAGHPNTRPYGKLIPFCEKCGVAVSC